MTPPRQQHSATVKRNRLPVSDRQLSYKTHMQSLYSVTQAGINARNATLSTRHPRHYFYSPISAEPTVDFPTASADLAYFYHFLPSPSQAPSHLGSVRTEQRCAGSGWCWERNGSAASPLKNLGADRKQTGLQHQKDNEAQRPFHCGGRFSANAVAPSIASSLVKTGFAIAFCLSNISS